MEEWGVGHCEETTVRSLHGVNNERSVRSLSWGVSSGECLARNRRSLYGDAVVSGCTLRSPGIIDNTVKLWLWMVQTNYSYYHYEEWCHLKPDDFQDYWFDHLLFRSQDVKERGAWHWAQPKHLRWTSSICWPDKSIENVRNRSADVLSGWTFFQEDILSGPP